MTEAWLKLWSFIMSDLIQISEQDSLFKVVTRTLLPPDTVCLWPADSTARVYSRTRLKKLSFYDEKLFLRAVNSAELKNATFMKGKWTPGVCKSHLFPQFMETNLDIDICELYLVETRWRHGTLAQ